MDTGRKKILMITDSGLGQMNVQLATAHALLNLYPALEVHLASQPSAAKLVASVSEYALRSCPDGREPIRFHALETMSVTDAFETLPATDQPRNANKFTWRNVFSQSTSYFEIMVAWSKEDMLRAYNEISEMIKQLQPDVIAVDPYYSPALSPARNSGVRWHFLAPNSMRDGYVLPDVLWKYPTLATGLPYPIPWHKILFNIVAALSLAFSAINNARAKEIKAYFREKIGITPFFTYTDALQAPPPVPKYLGATLPELDYPMPNKPDYLVGCGPMLRPSEKLARVDPELESWLAGGPTILINLGSHMPMDEQAAAEMAGALRILFDAIAQGADTRPELRTLRVLWKLRKKAKSLWSVGQSQSDYDTTKPRSKVYDLLEKEIVDGRVRIVSWLEAEPLSILESGHITCAVHHGGANASLESMATGTTHVVLPSWIDCFDWANRIEYLGVGRWGNRRNSPRWKAQEVGEALIAVVCGPESDRMTAKARALSDLVKKSTPGREVAARALMEGV